VVALFGTASPRRKQPAATTDAWGLPPIDAGENVPKPRSRPRLLRGRHEAPEATPTPSLTPVTSPFAEDKPFVPTKSRSAKPAAAKTPAKPAADPADTSKPDTLKPAAPKLVSVDPADPADGPAPDPDESAAGRAKRFGRSKAAEKPLPDLSEPSPDEDKKPRFRLRKRADDDLPPLDPADI